MEISEAPSKDQVRILVVDDHPNTANMLARALTQLGPRVDVVSAISGADALEKVKDKGVDILITDMIMPGMTGLELIEKMQNHHGGKPSYTYLVTAYDVPGLKVTAHRLKVNEVIVKPVRPERIFQIATQAIEEMKHATQPVKKLNSRNKNFKVLVVDDQPDNVTLLVRYLGNEGYEHITAQDGVEALKLTRALMPDLVLLDINMPQKDGFAVLEEIRADPAIQHTPVIILTAARLDPADVQSGLNLGADDYITKPFDRHELMARIRTRLRVKEAEDVIRRRNRELSLLPEIGKELSARLDIKDLANVLLKRTVETLGANQGSVTLLNAVGAVRKHYQFGMTPDGIPDERGNHLAEVLKTIKEQGQGFIIDDTLTDKRWPAEAGKAARSAVIVPLFGRHELLGLLTLTNEQDHYFNLEHLLLLQAIASQAAIAIENASLYSNVLKEQRRLAAVLQNAAEAILLLDEDGCLVLLNPAGERLFTDFNTKLNQPMEPGAGYDDFIRMTETVRTSRAALSGEVIWPDNRTFAALITPVESGGSVAILHDVTSFKDVERVKDEFIATASHDLKNPITSILGFSQLMAQAGPLNEAQGDFIQRIQGAAHMMNELVQNMMQLAQIDLNAAQKHKVLDMSAVLCAMAEEFSSQAQLKGQTFQFVPLHDLAQVNGDLLQMRQLFRNLLGNAIKYTPKGGHVTLSAQIDERNVKIGVQDTGYGIPAADLPFIFDRFYRAHHDLVSDVEGNGLGLAIVKSIVDQHHGTIHVESEHGKGTHFSLSIPLAPAKFSEIESANSHAGKSASNIYGERK